MKHPHESVLLQESIQLLQPSEGGAFIDATLGLGGHSVELCKIVGERGVVVGIDQDEDAILYATERIKEEAPHASFRAVLGNFRDIKQIHLDEYLPPLQGILFDLGWNSTQLSAGRGFSFQSKDPLYMTYQKKVSDETVTAATIINEWSENDLAESLAVLGEERFSNRIAHAIVLRRRIAPIKTADDLAEIVADAVPPWYRTGRINPATKTFQTLRILVNDELSSIEKGIRSGMDILAPGGRLVVITFHSIEDGLVKRMFKGMAERDEGVLITRKPLKPTREETLTNPRARSAKIRAIEKI